ncbi:MAG TPA: hypothetical protein VJV78_38840, partial [Polyangiales bacterium]|nr:hypothetical protein [Polyangiales bacterium]
AGASGAAPPTPVECGDTVCEAPPFLRACCLDEAKGTCGIASGNRCTPPPTPAEGCPTLDFPGFFTLPGCCTSRGMCGIDATMFGAPGCLDLATAAERARNAGATAPFPSPRPCDEADAGVEGDGGV